MSFRTFTYKINEAIRKRVAPTLKFSQYFYEDVLFENVHERMAWLDVGCGHHILPEWRAEQERLLVEKCETIVGVDYDFPSLKKHTGLSQRVRADITQLPFGRSTFDLVTANMVVEHLEDPDSQFRQIRDILRPGGVFIFHTPNSYGYVTALARLAPEGIKKKLIYLIEEREEEDVFETHYRANSKQRIEQLAKLTGFELVKLRMLVTDTSFSLIPPLGAVELVWIRLLMTKRFAPLRTNIIAILRKV